MQLGLKKVRKDQQYDLRWTLGNLLLDENRLDDAEQNIRGLREMNAGTADYLHARLQMLRGRWFESARAFEKLRPVMKGTQEIAFQIDIAIDREARVRRAAWAALQKNGALRK